MYGDGLGMVGFKIGISYSWLVVAPVLIEGGSRTCAMVEVAHAMMVGSGGGMSSVMRGGLLKP